MPLGDTEAGDDNEEEEQASIHEEEEAGDEEEEAGDEGEEASDDDRFSDPPPPTAPETRNVEFDLSPEDTSALLEKVNKMADARKGHFEHTVGIGHRKAVFLLASSKLKEHQFWSRLKPITMRRSTRLCLLTMNTAPVSTRRKLSFPPLDVAALTKTDRYSATLPEACRRT